ncbi:MAG: hypothetical protein JWR83_1079 [Aeromicrobium sp.]|nr:hypothetical protein [Aeromicrobium sp.]
MFVRLRFALLAPALLALPIVCVTAPAQAASTQIYGRVTDSSTDQPVAKMKVELFGSDWGYLGSVNSNSRGVYGITVTGAGDYHLQVVDRRPVYDTSSYARKLDVRVHVATTSVRKNVSVTRGGSVGGTVHARGKPAAGALVRAVSDGGQVYEVRANNKGQYAIGGLGRDAHRVFAYDPKKQWVGNSKRVGTVARGSYHTVSFSLQDRASAYEGFLTVGGNLAKGSTTVTAVNKRTGEYWVQKIVNGDLSLRGLTAGRYSLHVPDTNGHFGQTFSLVNLPKGRTREADVNLGVAGGTLFGIVVDDTTGLPLKNASVRLSDADGATQSEVLTSSTGAFTLGGTLRAETGVTVTVLTYGSIDGHNYTTKTLVEHFSIADDTNTDLGTIRLHRVVVPPIVPPVVVPPVVPLTAPADAVAVMPTV